ncbi:MAG: family 16 glycoside hydrolase, partial [Opitutaceae bacterium]
DTKPIALFNGRNFDGLTIFTEAAGTDPATVWKIEGGMLRCLGVSRGYVRTTLAYSDYRLRLEWRWPVRAGNSGVFVNMVGRDLI